jgi:hypothetical protein
MGQESSEFAVPVGCDALGEYGAQRLVDQLIWFAGLGRRWRYNFLATFVGELTLFVVNSCAALCTKCVPR